MENLGYKEGSAKPRRIGRTISVFLQNESEQQPLQLSDVKRKSNVQNRFQWDKNNTDAMLEVEYPSEDCEYMECGPSPPAENTPSMFDHFEEVSNELAVGVSSDTLRFSLIQQMENVSGRSGLLQDIENGAIIAENVEEQFKNATLIEKNIAFLWSAFTNRWDLLEELLYIGAELNFYDQSGISALHAAVFSECLASLEILIAKGMDVNYQPKFYTPLHCGAFGNSTEAAKVLLKNGALITKDTIETQNDESLLHCAVRANSVECVKLFLAEGADVNSLKPNGTNPIHLASDLGNDQCLKELLKSDYADPNLRICMSDKDSTALHLAADEGNVECVNLLLGKGADAKLKNHRGFTPLHLAARTSSLQCVDALLKNGNADPNAEDLDQRTPLHTAISKAETSFQIIENLISWGANINHRDIHGFSPLHLAALDGLAKIVEMLIYYGADVTTKSKKGTTALNVITRKTPASVAMIKQKLDSAIKFRTSEDPLNREVELELDFRQLLQHCHPREVSYLNTFVDEDQKEILQHPLCSSFLYIKWGKIRKYYIGRLIFCFIFVLFLSVYVLTALAHNCYNSSKTDEITIQAQELCQKQSILGDMLRKNPFVMEMQWWVLVAITILEISRKLYGMTGYTSVKNYVMQVENSMEWFVIISVFAISYIYTKQTYTFQNHIGAFAVLIGWTNLMFMVGQLPVFDVYVAMYTKVQGEFAKLFMAYSCMLVGFTISFCVIFPDSSSFANPFVGFIAVLVMMTGEQDLSILVNEPDGKDPPFLLEISAQITFILFLMFVTIVLMNLLVGIAVHDIQGLKRTAGLSKLVRQTKLISYIESALFNGHLPAWLRKMLQKSALISPQPYRVRLCVKPLNPCEKRLPHNILMAAYEVARERKQHGPTISRRSSAATYPSFNRKFNKNFSQDYDNGLFATNKLSSLATRIEENAEQIELLGQEILELKDIVVQQHQMSSVVNQLLAVVATQIKQKNL